MRKKEKEGILLSQKEGVEGGDSAAIAERADEVIQEADITFPDLREG